MAWNEAEKNSEIFNVTYKGMNLEFELFTRKYILDELNRMKQKSIFESIYPITIPKNMGKYRLGKFLQEKCGNDKCEKYHFFSYIKFFDYGEKQYGLVGGKTNYQLPDISFDNLGKSDNRISRTFLNNDEHLKWSSEIIILNHAPNHGRKEDNAQSKFIECFVQRKFNLFDS